MQATAAFTPTGLKRRAIVIKAMGHPSRLAMLDALRDGERCVCELQELVGSDMSTVSKHLSVMKSAGLVEDRKEGLKVHYRLRVPCVLEFLDCIDAVLDPEGHQLCTRQALGNLGNQQKEKLRCRNAEVVRASRTRAS